MKEEVRPRLQKKDPLVVGDKVFISSNVWDLTEKEIEKARNELGETEEKRRMCLQELKSRLSKEGSYRTDDYFLLAFLRVRKFNCDKAFKNIKLYYEMKRKLSDYCGTPSKLSILKNYIFCLPYTDEEGRLIYWDDAGAWNPHEVSLEECARSLCATLDIFSMNPRSQVNGVIGIVDVKELTVNIVSELLRKNRILKLSNAGEDIYPLRPKKIIITNTGHLTRLMHRVLRPMLNKKISERVILLGSDLNELHQHVNPALLPKKLGGTLEDDFCRDPNILLDNLKYLEYDKSFTGDREIR